MLEFLKNVIFYAGVGKSGYESVRDEIRESNRKNLLVLSIAAATAILVLIVFSFFDLKLKQNRTIYIAVQLVCGFIAIAAGTLARKYKVIVPLLVYIFAALLLLMGIALGTIIMPDEMTVTYIVMLLAVPLVFTDRPIYMILVMLASMAVYLVLAAETQTATMFSSNMTDVLIYGFLGIFVSTYMMVIKAQRYTFEREKKFLSEYNQLTGMLNRRSYEQHLQEVRDAGNKKDVTICAFDVNGLKTVNDTLGHRAGDELLKGAADCLEAVFGQYGSCYRVGGDEYMAILDSAHITDEELRDMLTKRTEGWKGSLVSGMSISVGIQRYEEGLTLDEMVNRADKRMYADKAAYYRRNGIDRRKS